MLNMVRDPVAWILVVAGVVEMVSGGTAARGAVLFAGAGIILLDRVRSVRVARAVGVGGPLPPVRPPEASLLPVAPLQSAARSTRVLAGAVGATALLALSDVQAWPMTAVVGTAGLLAVGWAWATEDGPGPAVRPPMRALAAWVVVLLALGLWELAALLGQPSLEITSYDHPTISFLLEPVLATYPGRFIALLAWVAAGRGLIGRS
jgi:hypothetical protein